MGDLKALHVKTRLGGFFLLSWGFEDGRDESLWTEREPSKRDLSTAWPFAVANGHFAQDDKMSSNSLRDFEHDALVGAAAYVGGAKDVSVGIDGEAAVRVAAVRRTLEVVEVGELPLAVLRR